MDIFNSNNELSSEMSGSLNDDLSYQKVLRELNINSPTTDTPIMLHVNKFGKFSIVCDSLDQIKVIKSKLGMKGLMPLFPGTMVAKDKDGNLKYVLTYDRRAIFPHICFN